jgi:hypothetical protein
LDASLLKRIAIKERVKLELRGDATLTMNGARGQSDDGAITNAMPGLWRSAQTLVSL